LVTCASGLTNALALLESGEFEAVLASIPLSDAPVEMLLEAAGKPGNPTPVVVHAQNASLSDAVRLTKLGAYHVLKDESDARSALIAAANTKRIHLAMPGAETSHWRKSLIGQSQKTQHVAVAIRLLAPRRCTILISGETGTGKEVVARAIHAAGPRAHLPMVSVNCSAFPEHLLEAELFGHTKGAFTGATGSRIGHFEQAHRSTLFLDEISDMPFALQSKLLRALQEREFQRLGSSEIVQVDVRVIAATNSDLAMRVKNGTFREDLYYRLNVVPLVLSPLRERTADIGLLVDHFIGEICRNEKLPLSNVTPEALDRLICYEWPGNVRQLKNAIEMAIALSGDRRTLGPSDFHLPTATPFLRQISRPMIAAFPDDGLDFEQTVENFERHILEQALRKTGGNKKLAADMLRLKRTTLSAKLKSLSAAAAAS